MNAPKNIYKQDDCCLFLRGEGRLDGLREDVRFDEFISGCVFAILFLVSVHLTVSVNHNLKGGWD